MTVHNSFNKDRIVNYTEPYTYKRLCADAARLGARYPELILVSDIGKSVHGKDILLLRLGTGEKKLLAVAGMHAREFVSTGYLMRCAEEYADAVCGCYYGYEIATLLSEYTLYLVPACSPDSTDIAAGLELPSVCPPDFDRKTYKNNANNVNLNANFPYLHGEVPKLRDPGEYECSESETRSLVRLCESNDFLLMLSFHARGNCLYWRDLGNSEVPGDLAAAQRLRDICGFELCAATADIKAYSGGFENWFRHRFNRCAICVELVADENISFEDCCRDFDKATNWERTRFSLFACIQD